MTCEQWFFKSKLIEVGVFAREHYATKIIIEGGAPVFCRVFYIAIDQPLWKIEQGLVGSKLTEVITKEKVVDKHFRNTLTDLSFQIVVVTVKEHDHFIVHQFGDTTGILPVHAFADIRLLHFIEV